MLNSQEFARRGRRSADYGQGTSPPPKLSRRSRRKSLTATFHGKRLAFFVVRLQAVRNAEFTGVRAAALSQFKKDRELHVSVVNEARYIQELIHAGMTADLYFEK